jgi:antitoxin YefM
MSAVTATEARRELFELIRRALRRHEPVRIQHREGGVVLISEDDYEGLLETLELLSVPGFNESLSEAEADIAAGRTLGADELLGDA